jgi:hypothetical protein
MIRPGDALEAELLREKLRYFESNIAPLPGLTDQSREVLIAQIIESQRRVRYLLTVRETNHTNALNPQSGCFDPLKGAVLCNRAGDFEEACWLVFLSVHFGRHRRYGWALSACFYGCLDQGGRWTWPVVSENPDRVLDWLEENEATIRLKGGGFGNHRKYQSLKARGTRGTGAVLTSYVGWVGPSHAERFSFVSAQAESPTAQFSMLYESLSPVIEFGRTARFDYLSMLGKLGLLDIQADSLHLSNSTGPIAGARLLLSGSKEPAIDAREAESRLQPLVQLFEMSFDVLEDALCNWQKSPNFFLPFRG